MQTRHRLVAGRGTHRPVADRHVQEPEGFVHRHAPMHAAQVSAASELPLPYSFARTRLHGVDAARFLPGQQNVLAARHAREDGRRSEIVVGADFLRTTWMVGYEARHVKGVVRRELLGPHNLAVFAAHGHDRIARRRCRCCVVLSGADVEQARLRVDGWCRPDRRARWSPLLDYHVVPASHRRRFGDRMGAPKQGAVRGIERDERPAKRTAFVHCIHRDSEFVGGHWRVYPSRVVQGRTRDDGMGMVPDFRLPELFAGDGIGSHYPPVAGAKNKPCLACDFRMNHGGSDGASEFPFPPHAARIPLQRVETAGRGADEHGVFRYQGVGMRRHAAVQRERPCKFERRGIGAIDFRRGLEAKVALAETPARSSEALGAGRRFARSPYR